MIELYAVLDRDITVKELIDAMKADGSQRVKIVTWYDNEYGFVSNMVRTLEHFANLAE